MGPGGPPMPALGALEVYEIRKADLNVELQAPGTDGPIDGGTYVRVGTMQLRTCEPGVVQVVLDTRLNRKEWELAKATIDASWDTFEKMAKGPG